MADRQDEGAAGEPNEVRCDRVRSLIMIHFILEKARVKMSVIIFFSRVPSSRGDAMIFTAAPAEFNFFLYVYHTGNTIPLTGGETNNNSTFGFYLVALLLNANGCRG